MVLVNWVITGSGNGLAPVRRQAFTWNNTDLLSIETFPVKFNSILIKSTISLQENAFGNNFRLQCVNYFTIYYLPIAAFEHNKCDNKFI